VLPIPTDFIEQQFESVMTDCKVQAIKTGFNANFRVVNCTGMLHSKEIVCKISQLLRTLHSEAVVVDPGDVFLPNVTLNPSDGLH
jgi:hydroxymethylpyrimidine/phosphomethylpyrimidine kinase